MSFLESGPRGVSGYTLPETPPPLPCTSGLLLDVGSGCGMSKSTYCLNVPMTREGVILHSTTEVSVSGVKDMNPVTD